MSWHVGRATISSHVTSVCRFVLRPRESLTFVSPQLIDPECVLKAGEEMSLRKLANVMCVAGTYSPSSYSTASECDRDGASAGWRNINMKEMSKFSMHESSLIVYEELVMCMWWQKETTRNGISSKIQCSTDRRHHMQGYTRPLFWKH